MKKMINNEYSAFTPQDEIDICEKHCPHPTEPNKCGNFGCDFYRREKAKLLKLRRAKEKREMLYGLQKTINR